MLFKPNISKMPKLLSYLLDSIFPLNCSLCGKYDIFASKLSICKKCIRDKASNKYNARPSYCKTCKSILTLDNCDYCNSRNIFFSNLNYLRVKGDLEREIIQKIKFGKSPHLSNFFRLGLRKLLPDLKQTTYTEIVEIPSTRITIRKRPIPVCEPVIRFLKEKLRLKTVSPFEKKSKELQSGKDFRERFIHAQTAFQIKKAYQNSLSGNYLLVDDVFTTGATINELAKLLLLNGATRVDVLVLVKGKT